MPLSFVCCVGIRGTRWRALCVLWNRRLRNALCRYNRSAIGIIGLGVAVVAVVVVVAVTCCVLSVVVVVEWRWLVLWVCMYSVLCMTALNNCEVGFWPWAWSQNLAWQAGRREQAQVPPLLAMYGTCTRTEIRICLKSGEVYDWEG